MNKLGAGISLIILGGIMRSAKVMAAAIYMSGMPSQSNDHFEAGMEYIGVSQDMFAGISVITGIVFVALYFYDSYKRK